MDLRRGAIFWENLMGKALVDYLQRRDSRGGEGG